MLKYVNSDIVFQEFPNEVTLAINLSNCPCRCPGCHSTFLWTDVGTPLTPDAIEKMLKEDGERITCIGFMGGDSEPEAINQLAIYIKNAPQKHKSGLVYRAIPHWQRIFNCLISTTLRWDHTYAIWAD